MPSQTLSQRQLNRVTLGRQLLLGRATATVSDAVGGLAGLQSQEPGPPYLALWTRLAGFTRPDLHDALHSRALVRATGVRGTLHTVRAADYLAWRPMLAPMLAESLRLLGDRANGLDREAVVAAAERYLASGPLTFTQLRARLTEDFPAVNDRALGFAVRMLIPLVMVPTDDRWSFPREASFTLARDWLPAAKRPRGASLIEAYLGAFGPASVADFQSWSGLGGMKPAFEALDLARYASESGGSLYDLPGRELPDPDTPAPARFLPDFDSVLLAYADRRRIVADEHRPHIVTRNLRVNAAFLVDGMVAGLWKLAVKRKAATLTLTPFETLPRPARAGLEAEGAELAAFLEPEAASVVVAVEG